MGVNTLGHHLKELRLGAGISGSELARRMGMSQPSISRIEIGKAKVSIEYVEKFCATVEMTEKQSSDLIQMTECFLFEFDKWGCTFESQKKIFQRERHASFIQTCCPAMIPGLLQSKAYMTTILSNFHGEATALRKAVSDRIRRQKLLERSEKTFQFIVSEAVLCHRYLDSSAQREQMELLLEFAEYPNIELRVLPFSNQLSGVVFDTFVLFDSKFATIEAILGEQIVWAPEEVSLYERMFNQLYVKATAGPATTKIIKEYAGPHKG